jgi:hypothetical protein
LEVTYQEEGYEFIAPTEHHPDPKWTGLAPGMFENPHIPGIIHLGDSMEDSCAGSATGGSHILGAAFDWDSMNQALPGTGDRGARLDNIRKAGQGLAFVAHPDSHSYLWSDQTLMSFYGRYDGIEVYNGFMDFAVWQRGQSRAVDTWTVLLNKGYDVRATAGDDFSPDVIGALNRGCVTAVLDLPTGDSPTGGDIESALREGRFYASYAAWPHQAGASYAPQIQGWWYDVGSGRARVQVFCPAGLDEVRFFTGTNSDRGIRVSVAAVEGQADTWEASLSCTQADKWVRARVTDQLGRVSLTQPIWLNRWESKVAQWPAASSGMTAQVVSGALLLDLADAHLEVPSPQPGISVVTGELVGVTERPAASPPLGYIGYCYSFTPAIPLAGSNSLTIHYDPADVGLCAEGALSIYRYDDLASRWASVPSSVDTVSHTVSAAISSLGVFAVSGQIGDDVVAPQVSVVQPADGSAISGEVTLQAAATDDNGVSLVRFFLDDIYLGSDTQGSDGWSWPLDCSQYVNGPHTIIVTARDASGNESQASVAVSIGGGVAAPVIGIAKPDAGTEFWGALEAHGTWAGGQALSGGLLSLGSVPALNLMPTTPSGTAWVADGDVYLSLNGPCTLTVEGSDAAGNKATASVDIVFRSFLDIPPGQWARSFIYSAARAGIVQGYPDGTYKPGDPVTRDQMAVYISRALAGGDATVPTGPATATFSDVPADCWAYKYIEYAFGQKVVEGYSDGTYKPAITVDRAQMAVFVARAIATPTDRPDLLSYTPPTTATFFDVPTSHWAYRFVENCKEKDVVQGYPDGTYKPDVIVTRDQMAVYVQRAFKLPM